MLPAQPASAMETLFSRGIDPSVLDPSMCHSHPDVPEEWPSREAIVTFAAKTRDIILAGVISKQVGLPAWQHLHQHLKAE